MLLSNPCGTSFQLQFEYTSSELGALVVLLSNAWSGLCWASVQLGENHAVYFWCRRRYVWPPKTSCDSLLLLLSNRPLSPAGVVFPQLLKHSERIRQTGWSHQSLPACLLAGATLKRWVWARCFSKQRVHGHECRVFRFVSLLFAISRQN